MNAKNLVLEKITDFINDADAEAAAETVIKLQKSYPDASADEIAERLIKRKCLQAGAVGAVTSGAAMIPGLGTFAAMTFGVATDIGMTFKLQAELTLEIAYAFDHVLNESEKQKIILTITGISAGSQAALQKVGREIAQKATADLAQKSIVKAIPFLGVAASAGMNIASTYVIGRRAQAYFTLGPDQMENWADGLRAISGVDERKLVGWLGETTENSWELISGGAQAAADTVVVTGKSTGKVVLVYSKKVTQAILASGGRLIGALWGGAAYLWPFKGKEPAQIEKKRGFWANLRRRLSWRRDKKEDTPPLTEAEMVEKITHASIEGAAVIGIIGAGDTAFVDLQEDQSYLDKLLGVFSWLPERWRLVDGETPDPDLMSELTQKYEPSNLIIYESDETVVEKKDEV